MSRAAELLVAARSAGVALILVGDKVECRIPAGVADEEDLAELRAHRDELAALLRAERASLPYVTVASYAALDAAGWEGPGPLDACGACGQGTPWVSPRGEPRHPRCGT